jgi:hypothetical protein
MSIWVSESNPQWHEINSLARSSTTAERKTEAVARHWYALIERLVIRPDATRDCWNPLVNRYWKRYESHRTPIQLGEVVKIYDSLNSSKENR